MDRTPPAWQRRGRCCERRHPNEGKAFLLSSSVFRHRESVSITANRPPIRLDTPHFMSSSSFSSARPQSAHTSRLRHTAHRRLLGRRLLLQHPQHRHRRFRHRGSGTAGSARRPASSRSSDRLNRSAGERQRLAGWTFRARRLRRQRYRPGLPVLPGLPVAGWRRGSPSSSAWHRQSRRRSTGRLGQAVSPGPHLRAAPEHRAAAEQRTSAEQPAAHRDRHCLPGRRAARDDRPRAAVGQLRRARRAGPVASGAHQARRDLPVPDPGSDPSRDARRAGRAGPRQDRLRQDHRLRHPVGHQAHRWTPGRRPSARADPAADPRTRAAGRPHRRTARRGRRAPHRRHLRWRRLRQPDRRAARRCRHRHRLPRSARGPGQPEGLRPQHRRGHRARRGRPHGRSRLPAGRSAAAPQHPGRRPAAAVLRHAGQRDLRAGQGIPDQPDPARRRRRDLAGRL